MSEILDSLIFDRVQEDLDNLTQKAYIDYADLNRIEGGCKMGFLCAESIRL